MTTQFQVAQRARVTTPYARAHTNLLELRRSEPVTIVARDSEWPDYVWCTRPDGAGGWVPEVYLYIDGTYAYALRDYDANASAIEPGEDVLVIEKDNGWYLAVNAYGKYGWLPANHVTFLDS